MTSHDSVRHEPVPGPSQHILETYVRLWQLETWLRRLVYVELRAFAGDAWTSEIRDAEKNKEKDKRLSHMPIPEENPLSYVQFSELCRIIKDDWPLFESFLPPYSIWAARLEEVTQIRNRIAHFRSAHPDDFDRVVRLLKDIDDGLWRFCTSYNDPRPVLPPSDDPVVEHFLQLDPFPWTLFEDGAWGRCGFADPKARLGVSVEVLCRPWASWSTPVAGKEGLIYVVTISARPPHNQAFDYQRLLTTTADLHEHIVHTHFDGSSLFHVTIPALLGADEIIRITERILTMARNCLGPSSVRTSDDGPVNRLANEWPEYLLGPETH